MNTAIYIWSDEQQMVIYIVTDTNGHPINTAASVCFWYVPGVDDNREVI